MAGSLLKHSGSRCEKGYARARSIRGIKLISERSVECDGRSLLFSEV